MLGGLVARHPDKFDPIGDTRAAPTVNTAAPTSAISTGTGAQILPDFTSLVEERTFMESIISRYHHPPAFLEIFLACMKLILALAFREYPSSSLSRAISSYLG